MSKAVIREWVEALESGNYPQTTGALHRTGGGPDWLPEGFCCLGVLCDLASKAGVVREREETESHVVTYGREFQTDSLPKSVMVWAGLADSSPVVTYRNPNGDIGPESLIELNDTYGLTFPEIAELIREQYL